MIERGLTQDKNLKIWIHLGQFYMEIQWSYFQKCEILFLVMENFDLPALGEKLKMLILFKIGSNDLKQIWLKYTF